MDSYAKLTTGTDYKNWGTQGLLIMSEKEALFKVLTGKSYKEWKKGKKKDNYDNDANDFVNPNNNLFTNTNAPPIFQNNKTARRALSPERLHTRSPSGRCSETNGFFCRVSRSATRPSRCMLWKRPQKEMRKQSSGLR